MALAPGGEREGGPLSAKREVLGSGLPISPCLMWEARAPAAGLREVFRVKAEGRSWESTAWDLNSPSWLHALDQLWLLSEPQISDTRFAGLEQGVENTHREKALAPAPGRGRCSVNQAVLPLTPLGHPRSGLVSSGEAFWQLKTPGM